MLAPCARATAGSPPRPIWGGERVGGAQGIRFSAPPSWSTAIRSGGWPPVAAAARSFPVSATRAAPCRDVRAEQDDPADLSAPDPPEQVGARGGAIHPHDELLADQLRVGGTRHGRRRRAGGSARRLRRRRRLRCPDDGRRGCRPRGGVDGRCGVRSGDPADAPGEDDQEHEHDTDPLHRMSDGPAGRFVQRGPGTCATSSHGPLPRLTGSRGARNIDLDPPRPPRLRRRRPSPVPGGGPHVQRHPSARPDPCSDGPSSTPTATSRAASTTRRRPSWPPGPSPGWSSSSARSTRRQPPVADRNKFVRCVTVKEQHAELVKHEVQVIWSDYFKPEHLAANPDLHTKVWNILKLAGKNKQNVDADAAAQLEASVKEFADIFWSTKK